MREAEIKRKTNETDIYLKLNLDGQGSADVETGIGFFDHMLVAFATHAKINLFIRAKGDINVDCHHTVEDTGIVLGEAIKLALGDKKGIARFSDCFLPMDDALAFVALDISNRSYCRFDAQFFYKNCGDYETDSTAEFMKALAFNANITLHCSAVYGENDHHITEAIYKAVARCLKNAITITGVAIPSSKGKL
ncbi:MAG: imidazoleglycerol-phosphate dehydratase HisB [Christensenellaceae bacterium]|jgi:imidazoleglycerol-phosphate dehydratase|nr:imidazoleglycerol-phosphate dehydratase HisB [Christensenellaceae bacterium]